MSGWIPAFVNYTIVSQKTKDIALSNFCIAPLALAQLDSIDAALRNDVQAMLEPDGQKGLGKSAHLLGASRGRQLVGAIYFRQQAGRVATIWAPRMLSTEPLVTAVALLKAALSHLFQHEVEFVQSLLPCDATVDLEAMFAAGFRHETDLLYLVCPIDKSAAWEVPAESCLQFEPYRSEQHDRLARIVEATYEGSLDCPGVDGLRDIDDVLAGYRATGVFSPDRWLIVRREGCDVGCLILAEYEGQGPWELVYMGLLPAMRGQDLGISIVEHAKRLAARAGQSRLVLAVDAANAPALRMYSRAAFQEWTRRAVMICSKKISTAAALEQR
jgi:GNAT superfamily N-acetyltransferase